MKRWLEFTSKHRWRNPDKSQQKARMERLNLMPWFHGKVSHTQAVDLLKSKIDGLFLVRESETLQGHYVVSVCYDSKVYHYRVRPNEEGKLEISPGMCFENLIKLVEYYGENADKLKTRLTLTVEKKCLDFCRKSDTRINSRQDNEKSQDYVPIENVGLPKSRKGQERWFHGKITVAKAEELLQIRLEKNGTFLVRESNSQIGCYAISVCYEGIVHHYKITSTEDNKLTLDSKTCFEDLTELIKHHRESADGLCTRLKQPLYKRDSFENDGALKCTTEGGAAEIVLARQKKDDPTSILERMSNTINFLKERRHSDIRPVMDQVTNNILLPSLKTSDMQLLQKYGDHLCEIEAPYQLAVLLQRLVDPGMEMENGWSHGFAIRSAFFVFSSASLKMATALGQYAVLKILLNDLDQYVTSKSKNEESEMTMLAEVAIGILYNCAKSSGNRQLFHDLRAVKRLAPFLEAEDIDISVAAILILSYISDDQKDLLEANTKVIDYILSLLRDALKRPESEREVGSYTALEMAVGLRNVAVNDKNRKTIVERGAIPLLMSLIVKGDDTEKECAANVLEILAHDSTGKDKIRETPKVMVVLHRLFREGSRLVREAVHRVIIALRETAITRDYRATDTVKASPLINCKYQVVCQRFQTSLQLSDDLFNPDFNVCYCTECHSARGDKLYFTRGSPAKEYGIPVGWCRFGLKVHPRASALDVFNKWHVAFHGTRVESIKPILECGDLLIPGDVALGGRKLNEEEGHFNDSRKPTGFDTKQIFVSPSVRYAGHDLYAKAKSFEDPSSKKLYNAKAVLQIRIGPDSYQVGPQTIGATSEIDPKFSNQEIEWYTKERGSIVMYGLLVKLDQI